MYEVELTPGRVTVFLMGETIMTITGGNALLIGLTYNNLHSNDEKRGQDFTHGVLMGINHVAMTGGLPVVADTQRRGEGCG